MIQFQDSRKLHVVCADCYAQTCLVYLCLIYSAPFCICCWLHLNAFSAGLLVLEQAEFNKQVLWQGSYAVRCTPSKSSARADMSSCIGLRRASVNLHQ